MSEYITLLGAEQVQSAARSMSSAASTMQSAASTIDSAVDKLILAMQEHADRIQRSMSRGTDNMGPR
jgi:hypothetical protein